MKKLISLLTLLCLLLCGCGGAEIPETTAATAAEVTTEGSLSVYFIDVGQADCALIECGGEYMLIDGGNRDDGPLVVSYLQDLGIRQLDTVICTHAHEDHVGGLAAVLDAFPAEQVFCPVDTYDSRAFDDFADAAYRQGLSLTDPEPGHSFSLGDATVTILGPVKDYEDPNNTSIVCRVDFGETSALFTGDMERDAESDMLDYWGEDFHWYADLLKIGHHGSDTSSGYRFLNEVGALYGVISLGENNDYGYPHVEPMARFRQADMTIFRTDTLGTIRADSDGAEFTFAWEDATGYPENTDEENLPFIGNKNSKNFHAAQCDGLPAQRNRVEFSSYDEAIDAGYVPCRGCLG